MQSPSFQARARHLDQILAAIQDAADPAPAVRRHLHRSQSRLEIDHHSFDLRVMRRLYLVACGKAAPRMLEPVLEILADRVTAGIVVHRDAEYQPPEGDFQSFYTGHPLPDLSSLDAGQAVADLLGDTQASDLILCLISGGTSAMLEHLPPGIELTEFVDLTHRLLKSGAPIDEINTVRKALSLIKGGGLITFASPATVAGLILSDVVGDPLPDIGSGPSVPQQVIPAQARATLRRLGLWDQVAPSIKSRLTVEQDYTKTYPEPVNVIIANNQDLVQAACDAAAKLGFYTEIAASPLQGEAHVLGEQIASQVLARKDHLQKPCAMIYGGETTVRVQGSGLGGRNQELALAAAIALAGCSGVTLLSFASDGVDGPTDAAGAIVDGQTCARIRASGIDPQAALRQNNSYPALKAAEALILSGPSGTNLNDVVAVLDYGSEPV